MWKIRQAVRVPFRNKFYVFDAERQDYYPNVESDKEADYITEGEALIMVDVLNIRDYGEVAPLIQEKET